MINQIQNSANKNVFAPLQGSSGASFAITKPFTETQKDEIKKEQKKAEEKKGNRLGLKITEYALVIGFGVFILARGVSPAWRKKVNKFFTHIDNKHFELTKNKSLNAAQTISEKVLKGIKSVAKKTKAIFNLAPLKDVIVAKACEKSKFLNKISNGLTNLFEWISVKTTKKAYSKTMTSFDSMYANFANINKNKNIPAKKVKEIEEKIQNIRNAYTDAFSETARNERLDKIKKNFDGADEKGVINPKNSIKEKVWKKIYVDWQTFFSAKGDAYKTFVSEDLASEAKINLHKTVNEYRSKITNDVHDTHKSIQKLMDNINTFVDPKDREARALIEKVNTNLKQYEESVKVGRKNKNIILNRNISTDLDSLAKHIIKNEKYNDTISKSVSNSVKDINTIVNENKKGEIQEILDIYKNILPEKDYEKLKKQTYRSVKSLNHSIDLETDKLFDKVRDLKIGSAPKDTLSVVASLGVVGWGLGKADNMDERTSVALKYGIPTVGAVMTALYCTVRLVSSGPSLLIGLISGLAMNKLGVVADDVRKKYKEKPLTFKDITMPTSILPSDKQKEKFKNFILPQ